jgi:oligoendopeptidase F
MVKMTQWIPFLLSTMLFACPSDEAGNAESGHLPSRDEIPQQHRWHLNDIFATDDEWQAAFDKVKASLPKIAQMKDTLSESAAILLECMKERDKLGIVSGQLFAYARMHRDENSGNTKYQAMTGKMEALLSEVGAATAFIEPEIIAMPDEKLQQFRAQEQGLAEYSFYFDNLIRQKKHVLSPSEEELLSRVAEVTQAPENIFNMLAHADMKFPKIKDESGREVQLSEGRYRTFIMSDNRNVRRDAFQALFNTYNQFRNTFASTLSGNIKKNVFFARTRKYESTLASALEVDNVPAEVYDNLITTVHNNLGPLHRYVELKRKALKLDDIHMYDLYTPLVRDVKFNIPYEQGCELVKEGLHPLGSEYLEVLQQSLKSGWIDVYENQGKQTGAYAWGIYGVHPFVLLNYNDRYDDVSTLAHELGHALHSYYSHKNQPYATSSYTTFTAEVASTTNEILLLDHMLKKTTDKRQRLYLINQYLEAVRGTVYRQTMFAEYEKMLYEKSEAGETLTADLLDELWRDLNVKYYGPAMVIDEEIHVEWARIPHFYWAFYVYQYVTGYSAATALAAQIQEEGQPAQDRYIGFLKSGGSDYSLNILKKAGVDMSSPEPIEITLRKFASRLDELEKLLNE